MFLGLSGVPLIMVPDNNAQEMFFRKINSKTLGVFFVMKGPCKCVWAGDSENVGGLRLPKVLKNMI
jgi:hypothetical protein